MFDHIAVRETLERAVELIGYGEELPEDEAIGVACGWWPCFSSNAGAYVQLNADGSGTIVTGAQENGTGAVMAMPPLRRRGARACGRSDFPILYQDTDAAPWDMGSAGSQTTFNTVRAVLDAADDVREPAARRGRRDSSRPRRDDLELVDGRGAREGLARPGGDDRRDRGARPRSTARAPGALPDSPPVDASSCVGRLGIESFLAPQLFTHAARVKVDRETGVVRVLQVAAAHDSGRILNRIGADGQVYGGVAMGIGMALSEGTHARRRGPPAEPAPARLQAA